MTERHHEVEVDERGRVSLGRAGAKPGMRYRVETAPDGSIRLTPVVSVPLRELQTLQNPELVLSIQQGLKEAEEGRTVDRGDFSQYLEEGDA